jgi:aspartate kinase
MSEEEGQGQRGQQGARRRRLTVAKFGGGVIGESGENLPAIVKRIQAIRERGEVGPVVIVSAVHGLTSLAMKVGKDYAARGVGDVALLSDPYQQIKDRYMVEPYQSRFLHDLTECFQTVERALDQIAENKEFVNVNRARVLAYSGEVLMGIAMSYVLNSAGMNATPISMADWPIITDKNFENADFLEAESRRRIHRLVDSLDAGRIVTMGGYIGRTRDGLETTYGRGGSDKTAANLAMLLQDAYEVTLDYEKSSSVLSADPSIRTIDPRELEAIQYLSYNEAILAGQFGMTILTPSAVRDIYEAGYDIPMAITDVQHPERVTWIRRAGERNGAPIKIVTGKKGCALLSLDLQVRQSLRDYVKRIRRFHDFYELATDEINRQARFLFLDGDFVKRHEDDLKAYDEQATADYGLAAITLVGDRMAEAPGVVAESFVAIKERYPDLNILDGTIQRPTSLILIIVRDEDAEKAVSAIHAKRKVVNSKAQQASSYPLFTGTLGWSVL